MTDLKQTAVTVAVAILFSIFVILIVDAVYPRPNYNSYCINDIIPKTAPITEPLKCDYNYGREYSKCIQDGGTPRFDYNESGCQVYKECDSCNIAYNDATKAYSRNVFTIVGIVAMLSIIGGMMWKIDFLGSGFMFAGIILLFYGTARYFGDASKILRILIIFIELVVVIWIGYKKLHKANRARPHRKRKYSL